jgi:tRNA1Val (adenine37-N6)-methyltransferase
MLSNHETMKYHGIELQETLAELSRTSIQEAGFANRGTIFNADLRNESLTFEPADVVVFNPPYFRAGSGRSSHIAGRRAAREAMNGDLDAFFDAACRHLRPTGEIYVVLRPERQNEALTEAKRLGLILKAVCAVHSSRDGKHQLDLLCFSNSGPERGPHLKQVLYLHRIKGERAHTKPVELFLSGQASSLPAEAFGSESQ